MTYREMAWRHAGGEKLFACEWKPAPGQPIRAVIGLVHGMGEHMGRYGHVGERLAAAGYAVIGFDQLGHGKTEGRRGHYRTYEDLFGGVDQVLAEAERAYPGLPRLLYGHSMGGNVTLNYLLRRKPAVAGAIASSPWLKLAFDPPAIKVVAARILKNIYPQYTDNRPMKANHLTSDPEMIRRYMTDPLGHGKITARFFFGMRQAGLWAIAHADELSVPLLLMHAGADQVTSIRASREFADRAAGSGRCTFREWPGLRHELHNELDREDVFRYIEDWLDRLLDGSAER